MMQEDIFPKDRFKCPKCGEVGIQLRVIYNTEKCMLDILCRRCRYEWIEKPLDERVGEIQCT